MTDDELRAMVRDSVARHLGREAPASPPSDAPRSHVSHAIFPLSRGADEGACVIEPAVRCNHCGYCVSYGH